MQLENKGKDSAVWSSALSFRLIISDLADWIRWFSVIYVTSLALFFSFIFEVLLFWKVLFLSLLLLQCFLFGLVQKNKQKKNNTPLKIRKAPCSCSNEGYWIKSIVSWQCCVYFHFRSFRRSVREEASSWVSVLCSNCQKTGRNCTASSHSTSTINVFNRWLKALTRLCFVAESDLIPCLCQRSSCSVLKKDACWAGTLVPLG